jgi:hypothetical protein
MLAEDTVVLQAIVVSAVLLIPAVALMGAPGGGQQSGAPAKPQPLDPAVKRDGWWIRIGKDVKAEKMTWRFSDPAKEAQPAAVTWQRANDPDNFDFPEAVRTLQRVTLDVSVEPPTAAASFCVFYAAHGAQLIEVSRPSRLVFDARARDKRCVP